MVFPFCLPPQLLVVSTRTSGFPIYSHLLGTSRSTRTCAPSTRSCGFPDCSSNRSHHNFWFSHWFPTRSCGLRHGPEITTTSGFPNCASTTSSGGTPQDENGFCVLRTSHYRSHSRSHAFGNIMCVLTDSRDRGNAKVFLRIHGGLHGRAHFLLCLYYGISSNPHYTRAVLWVSSTFLVFSSTFLLRFTNEILQF